MKIFGILIVCVIGLLLPIWLTPSQSRMFTEMLYLSLFALSFSFLYSHMGLLSFGHNLSFGLGAYAVALYLNANPDGSLWMAFLVAACVACLASAIAGLLLVRLSGGYFALMTMAICQLAFFVAGKWRSVTRGEDGLMVAIPKISLPGLPPDALPQTVLLCWVTFAVVVFGAGLLAWYLRTPLGRATILLRENESRASFLGYETHLVKLAAFSVAGITAGLAGALFALYQGLVSPVVLGFGLSGDVIMMTLIGGGGSFIGPAIGAAIYTAVEDVLPRFTEHPRFVMASIFVTVVLFLPAGISGLIDRIQRRRERNSVVEKEAPV